MNLADFRKKTKHLDDETEIFINGSRTFHLSYSQNLGGESAAEEIKPLVISITCKAFYSQILDIEGQR